MKIEVVPMAGLIFGILVFDNKWTEIQDEGTYFELIICLGMIGIKLVWYD